jgi:pyruvate formate lyase activating enzyme
VSEGTVFNIQRFSTQDGPGVRSTVFMKGCPLSCAWCHNPESQAPQAELLRMENRCMGCGLCSVEERDAGDTSRRSARDLETCPTGALQQVGQEMESSALVRDLLQDRIFYDESGGGVTFSGGEPLMQAPFLTETLKGLRAEGVQTALDTCGFAPWEDLRDAANLSDLILYDLKLMDEARHREATGQSNRMILENLRALARVHPNIWIRVPVIPGINDDETNLEASARFLSGLPGVRKVDLLPYHGTGEAKFARLGKPYALNQLRPPSPQRLEELAAIFRARGLDTTTGGHP